MSIERFSDMFSPESKYYIRSMPGGKLYVQAMAWLEMKRWELSKRSGAYPAMKKRMMTSDLIRKNFIQWFVETGTFLGDTTYVASKICKRVDTIEVSERLHTLAEKRFSSMPHVHCHLGDSGDVLGKITLVQTEPALFWLDGHFSGGFTARGAEDTPVFRELLHISARNQPKDIILIDDARCFGTDPAYPSEADLMRFAGGLGYQITRSGDTFLLTKP